jgi:ribonucleotide monophosphatase NagD (HAD superfamily)
LALASLYINNGGAKFICTNDTNQISLGNGMKYPGAGSIVEGIQITLNNK